MKKAIFFFCAVALALTFAPSAMAGVEKGDISISPFLGVKIYDGSQQLDPSFATGLRLGYNLTRRWGIESQFTYGIPKAGDGSYRSQYSVSGDILFHLFPEGKIVPFAVLGGGWSRSENSIGSSQGGTLDYGAGVKFFVTDSVALRMDVRQVVAFSPVNGSTTDYWQNTEVTMGLCYRFGKAPARATPVKGVEPAPPPVPEAAPPEPIPEEGEVTWLAEQTEAPPGKILITGLKADRNELEIMANEKIRDYKIFTLPQPSRLVIDIPNAVSGFTSTRIIVNRVGIATIRFESYPEYLRIFLDASQGRLIPYRVEETEKGLKIIVTSPYQKAS